MNFDIPETWLALRLGDVIDYGKTEKIEPDAIEEDMWVLELEDVEKDTSRLIVKVVFKDRQSKSTKNKFKKGDVLYGKLRPYLNKIIIADQDGCCTTEIIPLKSNGALDNRYLFYWLRHPDFLEYVADVSHGINMPRLGTDAGKASPFVLAPFNEQKRIADKLDTLLAAVDACRARLDKAPALIKRFRQSVLSAATSGALTEDWRELQNIELGEWINAQVQDIAAVGTGSTPLRSNDLFYANGTIPWITSAATSQEIVTKAETLVTEAAVAAHRLKRFEKGTLLIAMYGEGKTRGQVCELGISATINQACAAIKVDINKALVKYVKFSLQSNYLQMRAIAEGGNQPNLNLSKVKEFPIQLPSIDEQKEIVRRVEALFVAADKMEASLAKARKRVDQLTPSILAQAFRGELVEQDPTDEPASALLARIATASTPAPPKRTTKKAA